MARFVEHKHGPLPELRLRAGLALPCRHSRESGNPSCDVGIRDLPSLSAVPASAAARALAPAPFGRGFARSRPAGAPIRQRPRGTRQRAPHQPAGSFPRCAGEATGQTVLREQTCRGAMGSEEKPAPSRVRVFRIKPLAVTCCGPRSSIATATPKEKPAPCGCGFQDKAPGGDLLLHGKATLPSAHARFTSEFGMGSGGTTPLWPPGKGWERRTSASSTWGVNE